MLTIEEYIAKRKKEDKLNEFYLEKRVENIRICTNYVFEYFEKYLDITEVDQKTILNNERLDKFRRQLRDYDKDIQDWLVSFYDEYGKHMHRVIGNILDGEDVFLLYSEDSEFRSISYECYSKLIKKYPFLKEQTDMLFTFIKEYHRVKSGKCMEYEKVPYFSEKTNEWIEKTQAKYNVNIPAFTSSYIHKFCDAYDKWPVRHRKKTGNKYILYEYDYRQKGNLFNINSFYTKVSKKPFIRGHKQELEALMMYYWLHDIVADEEYWNEYLEKIGLLSNRDMKKKDVGKF